MSLIEALEKVGFLSDKRLEYYYQEKLHQEVGGQREVVLPNRKRIDLLTKTELIEVKHAKKWSSAIHQLLAYSAYYPNKQKRLHLFGLSSVKDPRAVFDAARKECDAHAIKLTWEA
ncbi:MAG: hypothetical protein ACFB4I_11910 [Cyanophyceae cyanobacterium]